MPKRTGDYREGLLKSLLDPNEAAQYVNAALEDSDQMFLVALRDVAEARQMAKVASEAGLSREAIYRTLSETGNPRYKSLRGILRALGLRFSIEPEAVPVGRRPGQKLESSNRYVVNSDEGLLLTEIDAANFAIGIDLGASTAIGVTYSMTYSTSQGRVLRFHPRSSATETSDEDYSFKDVLSAGQ